MNIKKELGEKIKRIRKNRGITQEKLAEMIDISPRNLSGIEKGVNFVKAETLQKILLALDITSEELFSNSHLKDEKTLYNDILNDLAKVQNNKSKLEKIYKMIKFFVNED